MNPPRWQTLKQLPTLLELSAPTPARILRRMIVTERSIMLPVKVFFIGIILYSFNFSRSAWVGQISSALDVTVETVQLIFWFYILANLIAAVFLFCAERFPLAVTQWTAVTSSLVDGIFVAAMALVTGGLDSVLFWLFVALIIRNCVSVPPGFLQLILNVAIIACYSLLAVLDITISANLDTTTRTALELSLHEELGQPFLLRLMVLLLATICCAGLELLLERQRLTAEEAQEFAAREAKLRSAGRLAAEFAHQIKNPLAVINNAAFSLQRSLRENKNSAAQQIAIIQEEVARADRVITQITGYAQLTEGRVEKLNVVEAMERAIAEVFPDAVPTEIKIHRNYGSQYPPLLMHRAHLSEIFLNLLQNARDALGGRGNIFIAMNAQKDAAIEISIRDDGPGIASDKMERIYEPYFTTKEKGSGLGLAIVRHNTELYGATVRAESELGKGAQFTLIFPAKTFPKLNQ